MILPVAGFRLWRLLLKKRAVDRDGGLYAFSSGDGMVRVPSVESIAGQEGVRGRKDRYYPSHSPKSFLKNFCELNPPTHPDPRHPITRFSGDQMIQFARAVGLQTSLASYGMLEDSLLKARVSGVDQLVSSSNSVGRSPFPSDPGSTWGDNVASRTDFSLPTVTETDASKIVAVEGS